MGVGHFTSPEGRARFVEAYEAALRALPEREAVTVDTEFGSVRGYRFGAHSGRPLVLLPGRGGTSAMWAPNVGELMQRRTVYAVDLLGEPGRSVQTVPIRDGRDQSRWLGAVLAGLGIEGAHLVGASIGGWLAFNHALRDPRRVASATLLDAPNVLARISARMMLAAVAAAPVAPRRLRTRFLSWISGGAPVQADDVIARLISVGLDEFRMALPVPAYPSDRELRSLTVPMLALIGGRSTVHDPVAALRRARALLPTGEAELWPGASHAISGECAARVNARVLEFVADVDRVHGGHGAGR